MKHFGKYKLVVEDSRTGEVTKEIENNNMILDTYFSKDNNFYGSFSRVVCRFGTGTTPPTRRDTTLESPLGASINSGSDFRRVSKITKGVAGDRFNYEVEIKFKGGVGTIQGNITELGLQQYGKNQAVTRALIKDSNGNPTTLTLGQYDVLTVYYTLGYTIEGLNATTPLVEKTIDINGVPTKVSFNYAGWTTNKGLWQTLTDYTSGGSNALTPNAYLDYAFAYEGIISDFSDLRSASNKLTRLGFIEGPTDSSGTGSSFKRVFKNVKVNAGKLTGNWGTIVFMSSYNTPDKNEGQPCMAITFDPPIPKTANTVLTLGELGTLIGRV